MTDIEKTGYADPYKKYLSYSQRELQAKLDKMRDEMPELVRQDILATVKAMKKELRSHKAKRRVVETAWFELMRPLRAEIKSLANMGRYKSKTYYVPERSVAIKEYQTVLAKALRLLEKHKRGDYTPMQLGKQKNAPNNGTHWTDWVPLEVKERVTNLFEAIPPRFKAKVKVPFERRIIEDDNQTKRRRLTKAIEQELGRAYKDLANDPDEYDNQDHREYIDRLELAMKAVIALGDDDYVPATWQGLFKSKGE